MNQENRLITEKDLSATYPVGAPVQLLKYTLTYDYAFDRCVLNATVENISAKTVKSVYFHIECMDDAGDICQIIDSTALQNVSADAGCVFGGDNPIVISNNITIDCKIELQKVVFEDGTVWRAEENHVTVVQTPRNTPLTENHPCYGIIHRDGESFAKLSVIPTENESAWRCSCSAVNPSAAIICRSCGADKTMIFDLFDEKNLAKKKDKEISEAIYQKAKAALTTSDPLVMRTSAEELDRISGYRDAKALAQKLRTVASTLEDAAEQSRKEEIYKKASGKKETIAEFEEAADLMKSLGKYKNAPELARTYRQNAQSLKNADKNKAKKLAEEEEKARLARKQKIQNGIVWSMIGSVILAFIVGLIALCVLAVLPNNRQTYKEAGEYLETKQYTYAWNLYKSLGDYKDSAEKVKEISRLFTGKDDAVFTLTDDNVDPFYKISEDGALSFDKKYKIKNGVLVLPDVVDDILVTSIQTAGFSNLSWLVEITIPDNVVAIGENAFKECSALKTVHFGEKNRTIGKDAFSKCTGLESMEIAQGITSLGEGIFSYCTSLKSVTLPDSVSAIPQRAFANCSALTDISFGNVRDIGSYAFESCTKLEKLTIPDQVRTIGGYAFKNCSALTQVDLGSEVYEIGNAAFTDCSALTSMTLPLAMREIGASAFNGCQSLKDIHYAGSSADFERITVNGSNDALLQATLHTAK